MTDLARPQKEQKRKGLFAGMLGRLNSIQTKFLVILLPPLVGATIIVMMVAVWQSYTQLESELLAKQDTVLKVNADALASPLWNLNIDNVERILQTLNVDPDVSAARILDEQGVEIASVLKPGVAPDDLETRTREIVYRTGQSSRALYPLGSISVDFNRLRIEQEIATMLLDEALLFALLLLVMLIMSSWAGRMLVSFPLRRFIDSIRRAETERSREPIPLTDQDEISRVMGAYNDLLVRLGAEEAAVVRQNKALSDANEELKELNALRNKFVGMAAHDLRNPLIAIRNMSEMIVDMDLDETTRKQFMNTVKDTSNQLLELLTDLLDVSAIESGTFKLDVKPDNVGDLLQERCNVFATVADKKGISLVGPSGELPDSIFDRGRLSQVVDNLISNAIKFSQTGTKVQIASEDQGAYLSFSVTDQGQGVPEGEIEHLFDEFKKLSVKPTGGENSTGLGLAIVRRIIKAHRGSIEVDSTVGEGTTFTVSLPKSPPEPEADEPE